MLRDGGLRDPELGLDDGRIAPDVSSPSASSSRIRRRTGSPRTSNACIGRSRSRRLYKSSLHLAPAPARGSRLARCDAIPIQRSRATRADAHWGPKGGPRSGRTRVSRLALLDCSPSSARVRRRGRPRLLRRSTDQDDAGDPRVVRVVGLRPDQLALAVVDVDRPPDLLAIDRVLDALRRARRQGRSCTGRSRWPGGRSARSRCRSRPAGRSGRCRART